LALSAAAGEEEASDALLRRSARADPEDFTMFSSRLARSVDRVFGDCQLHGRGAGRGQGTSVLPETTRTDGGSHPARAARTAVLRYRGGPNGKRRRRRYEDGEKLRIPARREQALRKRGTMERTQVRAGCRGGRAGSAPPTRR
jgi:hypothetical protein